MGHPALIQLAHPVVAVAQTKVVDNPQQPMQLLQAVAAELLPPVVQVELQIVAQLRAVHFRVEMVVQLAEQKVAAVPGSAFGAEG